jgi:hypothetical protein
MVLDIDAGQVPAQEVPCPVVENLRDALPQRPGRRRSESGLFPQCPQADGIVAAGVEAVNVEDLDGVPEFVVVARRMVAMTDMLEP